MNGHALHDLVAGLATSYALVGLLLALTGAAVLNVIGALRIPTAAMPAFFSFYGLLVLGFGAAFTLGLLKTPTRAAMEMAAIAESGAAAGARSRNVRLVDDPSSTGSLPVGVVYIQAPDMDARFQADGMWRALKSAGFRSPGIELVSSGAPARPEVRYFNDGDRPLAENVAAIAAQQGLADAAVLRAAVNYQAPRGQIELWYPR